MLSSSEPVVAWRLLVAAATACGATFAAAAPVTHCHADEKVFFSCVAGKKTVSLCGQAGGGELVSLTYRYGLPGKVEYEFSATHTNGNTFFGTVEPDSPRAQIREVWFDRGDVRYLMTACLGGDCPYEGGLAVLKKSTVLSKSKCGSGPDAMALFSDDLVEFGDGTDSSRSHTTLLKIGDYSNSIDLLYPVPASAFR
jgi:hypothetical protein